MATTIIRNEKRIKRLRLTGQIGSVVGLTVLIVGFLIGFRSEQPEQFFGIQLISLLVGWVLAQVSLSLNNKYGRTPRVDEVLDKAIRGIDNKARLYHYVLPAPHVLLTRSGPIILVGQPQSGTISVNEKGRWRQKRKGLLGFLGREGLGNPSREAEIRVSALANFIRKNAPEIEEVPLAAVIVFTSDKLDDLDVEHSPVPALPHGKLKGFMRKQLNDRLPPELYARLREIFDEAAGDLVEDGR
jgi:hypothetical protein